MMTNAKVIKIMRIIANKESSRIGSQKKVMASIQKKQIIG